METLKKYFWVIFFTTLIGYSTYLFGYLHLIKGYTIDEVLGPKKDIPIVILTETSLGCIQCHGKSEIRGAKEFDTPWGTQKWKGYEVTYIDPHAQVKAFQNKKKRTFKFTQDAYAQSDEGNHPVGVIYPVGNREYRFPPTPPIVIPNNYVQCESCHAVHDAGNPSHGTLIMDNSGSRLCLGCHIK